MTRLLAGVAGVLITIAVLTRAATLLLSDFTGRDWLIAMFGMGGEANLPATFSGGLLLLSGLLAGAIALGKRRMGAPFTLLWGVLSGVFLFLSLDELASIHDHLSVPLSLLLPARGALLYLWVVPYGLATLILFLVFLHFLTHLPASTRRLFLFAGAIYVGGALGIELLQASSNSQLITTGPVAAMSVIVEESMEMFGIIIFIHALLSYIQQQMPGFALRLSVTQEGQRPGDG